MLSSRDFNMRIINDKTLNNCKVFEQNSIFFPLFPFMAFKKKSKRRLKRTLKLIKKRKPEWVDIYFEKLLSLILRISFDKLGEDSGVSVIN